MGTSCPMRQVLLEVRLMGPEAAGPEARAEGLGLALREVGGGVGLQGWWRVGAEACAG